VWAEPGKVDACAREFEEDAEKFVKTAEELCGDYKWGRYDALVLPSSFPFGGMENPNVRPPRRARRPSWSLERR
jgi:leukotriene-A4 hydrolase